jgi:hypothetical protein
MTFLSNPVTILDADALVYSPTKILYNGLNYTNTTKDWALQGFWEYNYKSTEKKLLIAVAYNNLIAVKTKSNKVFKYIHTEEKERLLDPYTDEYNLKLSVVRTAFMGCLLKDLISQGKTLSSNDGQTLTLQPGIKSYSRLKYGNEVYRVSYNTESIMRFYMTKSRASEVWYKAVEFDKAYKHAEWRYFHESIKFKKIV